MMGKQGESLHGKLEELACNEESSRGQFRACLARAARPQLKSLILAICDQKARKAEKIRAIEASREFSASSLPEIFLPSLEGDGSDELEILSWVAKTEEYLAQSYETFAQALGCQSPEGALLASLAADSRKHATWAQDRLDLQRL